MKYVGVSYVDARRKEFLNLTQGKKLVVEYEAEFLCLSRYARVRWQRTMSVALGLRIDLEIASGY